VLRLNLQEFVHLADLWHDSLNVRVRLLAPAFFDQSSRIDVISRCKQVTTGRHRHGRPSLTETSTRFLIATAEPGRLGKADGSVYGHEDFVA
jgi:hypothetical protein